MMTFKQFIASRYPKQKSTSPVQQIRKSIKESKGPKDSEIATFSKWDLLKWMANEEGDTVAVEFLEDGTLLVRFVDVEID